MTEKWKAITKLQDDVSRLQDSVVTLIGKVGELEERVAKLEIAGAIVSNNWHVDEANGLIWLHAKPEQPDERTCGQHESPPA